MKKKIFVFSDVHGEDEALRIALAEAGYDMHNPDHILAGVGDLFDRGDGSRQIFELMSRREDNIWIKGNHDLMLEEALEKGLDGEFVFFNMLHNGLDKTIASFAGRRLSGMVTTQELEDIIAMARRYAYRGKPVLDKIKSLPLYYETKHYIFVHAGLFPEGKWQETPEDFMTWDIECSHLPILSTNKTVIIGHHHAFRVRAQGERQGLTPDRLAIPYVGNTDEHAPVRFGNKIAIDPCSNLTKKINVLIIEDELIEPKEEEKVEEVSQPIFDEHIISNTTTFRVNGNQWVALDPLANAYTYTTIR